MDVQALTEKVIFWDTLLKKRVLFEEHSNEWHIFTLNQEPTVQLLLYVRLWKCKGKFKPAQ